MEFSRLLKHVTATQWRTRMLFPQATLDAIEQAISRAERAHAGEIRVAIETALAPAHIFNNVSPRARARDVFAQLRHRVLREAREQHAGNHARDERDDRAQREAHRERHIGGARL